MEPQNGGIAVKFASPKLFEAVYQSVTKAARKEVEKGTKSLLKPNKRIHKVAAALSEGNNEASAAYGDHVVEESATFEEGSLKSAAKECSQMSTWVPLITYEEATRLTRDHPSRIHSERQSAAVPAEINEKLCPPQNEGTCGSPWLLLRSTVDEGANPPREGIDDVFPVSEFTLNGWRTISETADTECSAVRLSKQNRQPRDVCKMLDASNVPYIDTHCHLDLMCTKLRKGQFFRFGELLDELAHVVPQNFAGCIPVFCDPWTYSKDTGSCDENLKWTKGVLQHVKVLGAVYGVHPHLCPRYSPSIINCIRRFFEPGNRSEMRAVAVGECGIDLSGRNSNSVELQKIVYGAQLSLAKSLEVPVVVHCRSVGEEREAEDICLQTAKANLSRFSGIHRHCFLEDVKTAEKWMKEFPFVFFGFTPAIHRRSSNASFANVLANLPLDRILIETDAPFFPPREYRSARPKIQCGWNFPPSAITVAMHIAELREIPLDTVLEQILLNTRRLYGI